MGLYVSANSREGTWGTGAIDAISDQLHRELPGLRDFSAQNIRNMRQFAEYWQSFLFHSPVASKLEIEKLGDEIEYENHKFSSFILSFPVLPRATLTYKQKRLQLKTSFR